MVTHEVWCQQCGRPLKPQASFCTLCGSPNTPLPPPPSPSNHRTDGHQSILGAGASAPSELPPSNDRLAAGRPDNGAAATAKPLGALDQHSLSRPDESDLVAKGPRQPLESEGLNAASPGVESHRRRIAMVIAGLLIVIVVATSGIYEFTSRPRTSTPTAASSTAALPTPGATATTTAGLTRAAPAAPTSTPTRTPNPQAVALADLQAIRAANLLKISFTGQWVAQLASKTPGIVDPKQRTARGDHTFQAADILEEYQRARNNPNFGIYVGLVLSTDYGTHFRYKGKYPLWITFAQVPGLSSAAEVAAWCSQQFPKLTGALLDDSCTPRTLDPPS